VAGWRAGPDGRRGRSAGRFGRADARERAKRSPGCPLARGERKHGRRLAERLGEPGPRGVQRPLNAAHRDAAAARDDPRAHVAGHLGDPAGVLVVVGTGFLTMGTQSAGVRRRHSGTAGRRENRLIGVFLGYASSRGRTFLDRDLYLPKDWAGDPARRPDAGVPGEVAFATKPGLARRMLERAPAAGVPAAWVTADETCGDATDPRAPAGAGRPSLRLRRLPQPPGVARRRPGAGRRPRRLPCLPEGAWGRLPRGAGGQGERLFDRAGIWLPYGTSSGTVPWPLARRKRSDPSASAAGWPGRPFGVAIRRRRSGAVPGDGDGQRPAHPRSPAIRRLDAMDLALTDERWERIAALLPPRQPATGRPNRDHRTVLSGVPWATRTGSSRRDLPAQFGPWETVHGRYQRWRKAGRWQRIVELFTQQAWHPGAHEEAPPRPRRSLRSH
jgi:transposase